MNILNKTKIFRGVDFKESTKQSMKVLDWDLKSGITIEGGALVWMNCASTSKPVLDIFPAGATAFYTAVNAQNGYTNAGTDTQKLQGALDEMRDNIYLVYQGTEETSNSYVKPRGLAIGVHGGFGQMEMKHLTDAQWAQVTVGNCLMIDSNGKVGSSAVVAAGTDANFYNAAASVLGRLVGTIILSKAVDQDNAKLITFVC